tara:strand:+ start:308 stop:1063 length:756 start_codon:yes stop_codon:yes gene_type:complete
MRAHEIPGYVQGHRFSDESDVFYDADNLKFKDLSGYGDFLDLEITTGTPAFEDTGANNRRGMLLDKQAQGRFIPAAAWETTVVFAIYVELLTSGTKVRYPYLFGTSPTETANGNIRALSVGANRSISASTPGVALSADREIAGDGIIVGALSFDQSTRRAYDTADGVTVNESSAVADSGSGNNVALGLGGPGVPDDVYCRFGDLVGDGSTTAEADLKIVALEHHFFAGNVISSHQDEVGALLSEMATYYGV